MLRFIIVQGWYKTEATHLIYKGIVNAMFPKATSTVFASIAEYKGFFVFTTDTRKLSELDDAFCDALNASKAPLRHLLIETEYISGRLSHDNFGKEAVEGMSLKWKEFKEQDTLESFEEKIKNEIHNNSDDK